MITSNLVHNRIAILMLFNMRDIVLYLLVIYTKPIYLTLS